jgi:hypothetical protein
MLMERAPTDVDSAVHDNKAAFTDFYQRLWNIRLEEADFPPFQVFATRRGSMLMDTPTNPDSSTKKEPESARELYENGVKLKEQKGSLLNRTCNLFFRTSTRKNGITSMPSLSSIQGNPKRGILLRVA